MIKMSEKNGRQEKLHPNEKPSFVKVKVYMQGPKSQNRFGAGKPPFCYRDFEPIFDKMLASPFYNACGDVRPLRETMIIVEIDRLVEQVCCAPIYRCVCLVVKFLVVGAAAHSPAIKLALKLRTPSKR